MSLPLVAMAEQALEPVPINSQPSEAIEDRLQCFFLVALLVCVVGCSPAASAPDTVLPF